MPERIGRPGIQRRTGMKYMPLLLVLRLKLWRRRLLTVTITLERH
jgi:hypothetical protein